MSRNSNWNFIDHELLHNLHNILIHPFWSNRPHRIIMHFAGYMYIAYLLCTFVSHFELFQMTIWTCCCKRVCDYQFCMKWMNLSPLTCLSLSAATLLSIFSSAKYRALQHPCRSSQPPPLLSSYFYDWWGSYIQKTALSAAVESELIQTSYSHHHNEH